MSRLLRTRARGGHMWVLRRRELGPRGRKPRVFCEQHQWPWLHRAEGLLREVGEAVAELVPVLGFKADPFPAEYY